MTSTSPPTAEPLAARWIVRATGAVAIAAGTLTIIFCVLLAGYWYVVLPLKSTVNDLASGNSPSGISRRRYQAEQLFILYSRDSTILDPSKKVEIDKLCEGYDTLAEAYTTQGVKPPTKEE